MRQHGEKAVRSSTRISKSTVEGVILPKPGRRGVLWDSELKGFGLRVTSTGVRTYVLRYQHGGRSGAQRQVTIGQHGSPWTADQARKRAAELLLQIRTGADPAAERVTRDGKSEEKTVVAPAFNYLADRWFARHVKGLGLRSQKDIEGVLRRDLKPALGLLPIDRIDKRAVADALEGIGDRSQAAANKAHKWLRQMFNWLVEKGEIERSPMEKVKRPYPEHRRSRVLSLLEVVVVWIAAGSFPEPFRSFYRLLLLTGQRLREVANLPWSELDLEGAEWLLPAARAKNKLQHAIPLADQALAILEALKGDRERPLGPVLSTNGRVGISGFSKLKQALDEEIERVLATSAASKVLGQTLEPWVVHDFRRSLATSCQAMGFSQEVTEAVLNQVSARQDGVRGVYQLYDYYDEKADTLARWAALIDEAVAAWERGDIQGVEDLDPVRRRRRQMREQRHARRSHDPKPYR